MPPKLHASDDPIEVSVQRRVQPGRHIETAESRGFLTLVKREFSADPATEWSVVAQEGRLSGDGCST